MSFLLLTTGDKLLLTTGDKLLLTDGAGGGSPADPATTTIAALLAHFRRRRL